MAVGDSYFERKKQQIPDHIKGAIGGDASRSSDSHIPYQGSTHSSTQPSAAFRPVQGIQRFTPGGIALGYVPPAPARPTGSSEWKPAPLPRKPPKPRGYDAFGHYHQGY